jgi:hypothetical protein
MADAPSITDAALRAMRSRFDGPLLRPGHDEYDAARTIWNGSSDRRPALIARCTGPDDVAAAIEFGRSHDLLVAVRGGGHSIPGHSVCEGGLMIDLSLMKGVRVDPAARTVRAQPGVKWGEFDVETGAHGLATPGGYVSTTGIAGLTLGGGIGWLSRPYGLTCDNLVAAEVITAEGDRVRASEDADAELLWGLRGGGGNFGVVTSFEYQLHAVPSVLGGGLVHRGDRAAEALARTVEFALAAPDELTVLALMLTAPDRPPYTEEMRGGPILFVGVCYAGDLAVGAGVVDHLRATSQPDLDFVREMPYSKLQRMLDDGHGWGEPWYEKAAYAAEITPEALSTFSSCWDRRVSTRDQMYMQQMGGRITRVPDDATPFENRATQFVYMVMSGWEHGQDRAPHVAWARETWEALSPHSRPGVYVNFDSEDDQSRVRATYGPRYDRLAALKGRLDPTNLFRLNQNILPKPALVDQ